MLHKHTPLPWGHLYTGYMFPRYFAETLLVPLARGIRPFAFKEAIPVNPMDCPDLYLRSMVRFFRVAL